MAKFKVIRYWDTYPDKTVATCDTEEEAEKICNKYQLDYTVWAWKHDRKYKELCIEETMNFKHKEMKAYLLGLTSGLRINKK